MKKDNLFILFGLAMIILVWLFSSLHINNALVLPTISQVFNSLKTILSTSKSYLIIFNTFLKLVFTMIISLVIAIILAILSIFSLKFEKFIKPMIVIFKTIPIVSIIILLLVFLGNSKSPYVVTLLVVLPIMYESLLTGFKNINPEILDDVKTISNLNLSVFRTIYIPLIFQYLMMGLTQSFGLGLKVMIMGEFIAQPNNTIGYIMQLERSNLNTPAILAWTIILIIIILVIELILNKITKALEY